MQEGKIQKDDQYQSLEQIPKLLCQQKKTAKALCCSYQCTLPNGLTCFDFQCQCFKEKHQTCEFLRVDHLQKVLTTNRKKLSPEKSNSLKSIDQLYLNMIQEISIERQNLQNWIDMYGLGQSCIKMLSFVKQNAADKVNGSLGHLVAKQVKTYDKSKREHDLTQKQIQNYWLNKKSTFDQILRQIRFLYKESIGIQSKIVTDANSLISFFEKPILEFKLLFRASQHKFSTSEFHRTCDGIPDTVVLIETQFGKKIGGFTSIKWQSDGSVCYMQDLNGGSFIFSVSENEKFKLTDTKKAIGNCRSYGPTFGQGQSDIYIPNESHTNKCNFNFPRSYGLMPESKSKGKSSQEIHTMFSGATESHKAATKEWEVFQIIWGDY